MNSGPVVAVDHFTDQDFVGRVVAWGVPRLRDLPWRRTRDPWAVLVSEVMLQQTQVRRVEPKWRAFLERFPTAADCAAAPLGDVLRLWHGLGYPRRARNLHVAAGAIVELGGFPTTLEELLRLPGVGQYTARAVRAFAFEQDAAVVDTNIARVYARVLGRPLTASAAQRIADGVAPAGQAWEWNQSLMDLGAQVCRPQPRCVECPVQRMCAWHGDGPDPAVGSAGVSRTQPRFEGSDRQARGRVLAALLDGPADEATLVAAAGREPSVVRRLIVDLQHEGLVTHHHGKLALPPASQIAAS